MSAAPAKRDYFASKAGFVLAAAGSAVGLGNIWRFSYQAAEGGGAAFVVLYILMTFLIGLPIMVSEFAIGRATRQSPVGAYSSLGGKRWTPMGYIAVAAPIFILAYFSVIIGWVIRYLIDGFSGFPTDSAAYFTDISTGSSAVQFHLIAIAITVLVVLGGVHKGIERVSLILMPLLLVLLLGFVVWAATLDGAGDGYRFYLAPSFEELTDINVIRQAASQAFLSLSVGMGVMITYGSYINDKHDLVGEGVVVSMLDFSVAFIGGLVVFPIIFAFGLAASIGESTVGTLFISLPAAIHELGTIGTVVGIFFFFALLVAGITSSISLLEVSVSSLIDRFAINRKVAVAISAAIAGGLGVLPALDQDWLVILDKFAGEFLVIIGALASLLLARRSIGKSDDIIATGTGQHDRVLIPVVLFLIRWIAPVVVAILLIASVIATVTQ